MKVVGDRVPQSLTRKWGKKVRNVRGLSAQEFKNYTLTGSTDLRLSVPTKSPKGLAKVVNLQKKHILILT